MRTVRIPLFAILLSSLLFISCKKEVINPTEAEKTQVELEGVIKTQLIKRVYSFDYPGGGWSTLPANAGLSWTFSNGYIIIDGFGSAQGHNLAFLYSYNVATVPLDNGTQTKALLLYFK